ncbi:MAG: hypothetical protein ACRD0K_16620 [Egibacteraceae bacterium]
MPDMLTKTPPPVPATPFEGSVAADLVLVVAPGAGRFQPLDGVGAQTRLRIGDQIGHVLGGRGRTDEVHCPVDAQLGDLLVRPGQAVTRGQALAWLRRAESR